jgi:hypothetical protein
MDTNDALDIIPFPSCVSILLPCETLDLSSRSSAAWPGIFGDDVGRESAEVGRRNPIRHSRRKSPRKIVALCNALLFFQPNWAGTQLAMLRAVSEMQASAVGIWMHELDLLDDVFVHRLDPRMWVNRTNAYQDGGRARAMIC